MVPAFAICLGLLSASLDPTDSDIKAYQTAKAEAQRDPQANIGLALWCEARGMDTERLKHLAIALLVDPKNATARGLLGMVQYSGRWQKPEQVTKDVHDDAKLSAVLAEYNAKRSQSPKTADGQWQLGLWCQKNGLEAESVAHLTAVVRLDPAREAAWKKLGYQKHKGRWMTPAQVEGEKGDAEKQKQANHHWTAVLEKARRDLASRQRRAEAEHVLAQMTDPRAVPSVWKVCVTQKPRDPGLAVQLLGQIDAPSASRALAVMAIYGETAQARQRATETLKHRDCREFADLLISLIREPIKYEIKRVNGLDGPGELFIEGKKFNVQRNYSPLAAINSVMQPGDVLEFDGMGRPLLARHRWFEYTPSFEGIGTANFGLLGGLFAPGSLLGPGWQSYSAGFGSPSYGPSALTGSTMLNLGGTGRRRILYRQDTEIPMTNVAANAEAQLQQDAQALEEYNASLKPMNDRAVNVLKEVSDIDLGTDREAWKAWWVNQVGYAYFPQKYDDKPTFVDTVPIAVPLLTQVTPVAFYRRQSCFAAGTPVHTLTGVRAIESLEVGDLVLTQDTTTGSLSFKPILVMHRNPPSTTFNITLGNTTVVSTPFHRFWKAGRGWVMARDLKQDDAIRTLGGLARVTAIGDGSMQKVYNLDVADTASFFVGDEGILVHDNSLPSPELHPFDAQTILASKRLEPGSQDGDGDR